MAISEHKHTRLNGYACATLIPSSFIFFLLFTYGYLSIRLSCPSLRWYTFTSQSPLLQSFLSNTPTYPRISACLSTPHTSRASHKHDTQCLPTRVQIRDAAPTRIARRIRRLILKEDRNHVPNTPMQNRRLLLVDDTPMVLLFQSPPLGDTFKQDPLTKGKDRGGPGRLRTGDFSHQPKTFSFK